MATSNYLEDALLNAVLRNTAFTSPTTIWVALFHQDPTDFNDTAQELALASYGRVQVIFSDATSGACSNSGDINFLQATESWGTVSHIGIYDSETVGNLLYHGQLTVPKIVELNDTFSILATDLTITLN